MPATPNKDLKSFGLEVRRLRTEMKMSQTALAKKAGFSNKQLNHIEYAVHWPSMKTYIALCKVLGIGSVPLVGKLATD